MKRSFIAFILFSLISLSCNKKPENKAGKLNIEAAIVYQMGGPQPVARVTFYLLKKDLFEILRESQLKRFSHSENRTIAYVFAVDMLCSKANPNNTDLFQETMRFITPHITQEQSTDFTGKASFTELSVGKYFLVGVERTRDGSMVWNIEQEIKSGENLLLIDQNNAASTIQSMNLALLCSADRNPR